MPAEQRAPKRIGTAVQTIFNNKWTYPAVPPNATYAFNNLETTGNTVPFWCSPRQAGTLQEKEAKREAVKGDSGHLPAYMLRDRECIGIIKAKGLTHEKLGLSNGELKNPVPFSLKNNFFSRRDGEFITLDHRKSVTRHHWGVIGSKEDAQPARRKSPPPRSHCLLSASLPPLGDEKTRERKRLEMTRPIPCSRAGAGAEAGAGAGQIRIRDEAGLKIGRGFKPADDGQWVLTLMPTKGGRGRSAREALWVKGEPEIAAKSVVDRSRGAKSVTDLRVSHGRSDEELEAESLQRKEKLAAERRMLKTLRHKMQSKLTDTKNLPMNLWKAFSRFDTDGSGRIERNEFSKVCEWVGMDEDVVGKDGIELLWSTVDRDKGGSVDFQEFLTAVVGHLVKL